MNKNRAILPTTLPRPLRPISPVAPEHIYYPFSEERPTVAGTGHLHWSVTAFTSWGENNLMVDSVGVSVEAGSEQEAIYRAMDIIQRPYYRVTGVHEACSLDKDLKE